MRNFPIGLRIAILAIGFTIPVLVLVYLLTQSQSVNIDFAAAEVRGIEYHKPSRVLFEDLMQHRTFASGVLAGDASFKDRMESKAREVDNDFAQLSTIDAKLGEEMHTTSLLQKLKGDWEALKTALPTLTPEESIRRHNVVVYDTLRVIIKMGNHSNLILDPDIDTYYLMDATQFKLAYEADQITQLQAYGLIGAIRGAQGQPLGDSARVEIAGSSNRARQYLREGLDNLNYALDYNPELTAALGGVITVTESSTEQTLALADKQLLASTGVVTMTPADWLAQTDATLDTDLKLFDSCLANLERYLNVRIEKLKAAQLRALGIVGVSILLTLGLAIVIGRGITGPINALAQAAEQVSLGKLDLQIDTSGRDEVSQLAQKFVRMQESMKIAAKAGGDL